MLYFGIFPEDYPISPVRLMRQWIDEGFVIYVEKQTLEEVAMEYLTELIHRSLVQVSKVGFDGKIKSCQVHDLLREVMIIRKMKDSSFCHLVHEDDESVAVGITRCLSITCSKDLLGYTGHSHIRAIHIFYKGELPENFMRKFPTKSKHPKVLDFEDTSLNCAPDSLGNLFHLRYLNLRNTKVKVLPKSIGKLQNLETLDLRQTLVRELPREINKLTKLRHLSGYHRNHEIDHSALETKRGMVMRNGIECLTSCNEKYLGGLRVPRGCTYRE